VTITCQTPTVRREGRAIVCNACDIISACGESLIIIGHPQALADRVLTKPLALATIAQFSTRSMPRKINNASF
jgi:hypothetical protein